MISGILKDYKEIHCRMAKYLKSSSRLRRLAQTPLPAERGQSPYPARVTNPNIFGRTILIKNYNNSDERS